MKYNKIVKIVGVLVCSGLVLVTSCKRYPDPPRIFQDYGKDSSTAKQRKVLLISIDGATGSEIEKVMPPNIASLKKNGKYSFDVKNSLTTTDAGSWVSMLTGVSETKHKINDSSFQYLPPPSSIGGTEDAALVDNYPTMFSYILQGKPEYKTAIVTPWQNLSDYTKMVDYNILTTTDIETKDLAVSILKKKKFLGVMVVDFHNAELAGMLGDFSASDPDYKAAILEDDGYVGELVSALKDRKNYEKENWLVIVTTNHGGSASKPSSGFAVYSNPSLKEAELRMTGFSTVLFGGSGDNSIYATMSPKVDGQLVYDFDKDFTLQFDVYFDAMSGRYPGFFGNKASIDPGTGDGFVLLTDMGTSDGNVLLLDNTSIGKTEVEFSDGNNLMNEKWHTITFSIQKNADGSRTFKGYIDGQFQKEGTFPKDINLNSPDPLAIGWQPTTVPRGWFGDAFMKYAIHNIKLFDTALDEESVDYNHCLKEITQAQGYDHLIGFWPCDEGSGGVFQNDLNKKCPFILHGDYKWESLRDAKDSLMLPCSVNPPSESDEGIIQISMSNEDIAANIFYWLKINISKDWDLSGQSWLSNFSREIYGVE